MRAVPRSIDQHEKLDLVSVFVQEHLMSWKPISLHAYPLFPIVHSTDDITRSLYVQSPLNPNHHPCKWISEPFLQLTGTLQHTCLRYVARQTALRKGRYLFQIPASETRICLAAFLVILSREICENAGHLHSDPLVDTSLLHHMLLPLDVVETSIRHQIALFEV